MQTTIVKWGNSHGIRIPKLFLQSIQLGENDPVDVVIADDRIIISKKRKKNIKQQKSVLRRGICSKSCVM